MIRKLFFLCACFCCGIVFLQVSGLTILWFMGRLSGDKLRDIQRAMSGQTAVALAADGPAPTVQPTLDELIRERARLSAEFDARDQQLAVFAQMTSQAKDQLAVQLVEFEQRKKAFDQELKVLQARVTETAVEQTRGVLLALPPADAAQRLLELELTEDVVLLKGMPEKSIAKILKEFKGDPKLVERGTAIFEALNRGAPDRDLVDAAQQTLSPTPIP